MVSSSLEGPGPIAGIVYEQIDKTRHGTYKLRRSTYMPERGYSAKGPDSSVNIFNDSRDLDSSELP